MTSPNSKAVKIMLDLETYGTKPGCKLMSISACTFMLDRGQEPWFFHDTVKREDQGELTEDADTLAWWATQDQEVFKAMTAGEDSLVVALAKFRTFISERAGDESSVEIWCNGATFDAPVIEAAYVQFNMPVPWKFRDVRCYRTLVAEFGHMVAKPEFTGHKHNSLHDAIHQAKYAELILRRLHGSR